MKTILEDEIRSQGVLLKGRAAEGWRAARRAASLLDSSVSHLVVAARGSSDNAATYLQYLAGGELGLLAALATPSLYADPVGIHLTGAMAVGISQSGRSPDVVSVLHAARSQGRPTVAITNDEQSPLAGEADVVIPLIVGDERSLASTKTFLASLQAIAQLVRAMAEPREALSEISELPAMVEETSAWALTNVESVVGNLADNGLTVVGRGLGLCAAEESALKIREVAGIRAEAYAAPDFLHGPIGADGKGATMWLVLSDEFDDASARDLVVKARQAGFFTLVSRDVTRDSIPADAEIVLPCESPNWITPILTVVVGQVVALRLGELRHRPIDQPPRLSKVTLTK